MIRTREMGDVVARDGTVVTQEMLDEMFERAEAGDFPGTPGPVFLGLPPFVEDAEAPLAVRPSEPREPVPGTTAGDGSQARAAL